MIIRDSATVVKGATNRKKIEGCIASLIDLIVSNGGAIHPNLLFCVTDKEMYLAERSHIPAGEKLLEIREESLIPITQNLLYFDKASLAYQYSNPVKKHTSKEKLLRKTLELYTATNKIEEFIQHSVEYQSKTHQRLYKHIRASTSVKSLVHLYLKELDENRVENDSSEKLYYFLSSRVIRSFDSPKYYLAPLLDFANHHQMAPFPQIARHQNNVESITLAKNKLMSKSGELFLNYGFKDRMQFLLTYGFVNQDIPFAISIPINIQIPEFGELTINSSLISGNQLSLVDIKKVFPSFEFKNKPHEFYCPTFNNSSKSEFDINFLVIPGTKTIFSLRDILELQLAFLDMHANKPIGFYSNDKMILSLEERILKENIEYYRNLEQLMQEECINCSIPAFSMLTQVIEEQLKILFEYCKYFQLKLSNSK